MIILLKIDVVVLEKDWRLDGKGNSTTLDTLSVIASVDFDSKTIFIQ